MFKIVVTGGAGFIGSHLVDKLIELGHEVIVIDDLSSGKEENINPKAKFVKCDITSDWNFTDRPDYVFHLAAIPRVPFSVLNPAYTHSVNVDGTLNILECSRAAKVSKVIFASSSSVYGDQKLPLKETMRRKPKSPYALHKSIGEQYMSLYDELYGLPTVSLRFFNVYGKRCDPDSEYSLVIGKFVKAKKEGKHMLIYGDGEQTRDFTHVSDVVKGLIDAMEKPVHNEVINLCNGNNISINKIADLIGGEKEYAPARRGDVLHTLGDNRKAKKLLDWSGEVTIEEGVKELLEG
jgi:UDP-glucose 4-epimerase